ncbi:MAG: 16S rRNA (guanine(966)-N(2))-methyltransferase RsmD [Desulfovibrio sp.]|nr:16S rRNA (guanine(966)-N(2))-methyltransferase RsmD [Desulfovibrio sp.]MBO6170880.1 16S rRNA (guanine(966)-N(2))-methyltransferase RsmD [Desulfovibrio sp.]
MRIIAGRLGGRILKTAEGEGYRPAMGKTREALFSMLEARGVLWPDVRALDLFAGTGSLALEAVSRGAPHALLVEKAPQALRCLRENIEILGVQDETRLWGEDVLRALKTPPAEPYNLVFMDPPYRRNLAEPVLRLLEARSWLAPGAFVTAEIEKDARPAVPPRWEATAERLFGQTRVFIWKLP